MAESSSSQDRTEKPTPRRLEQAREEGRVARSPEVSGAVLLLGGALILSGFGAAALASFSGHLLQQSAHALAFGPTDSGGGAVALLHDAALGMLLALLPFALAVASVVTLVDVAQTRGVLSWTPLQPKLSHLNPATNLKRILGPDALVALGKSLVKLAAVGFVAAMVLNHAWPQLASLGDMGPAATADTIRELTLRLALMTGLAFLAVALVDYGYQRLRFEQSLRMTKQEIVLEHRDAEGDPIVKARILSIMRARARQRMLQAVPNADVVIVNPTHVAVALRYDIDAAPAPIVVAMGERKLAERIKAIAQASGVTVIENRPVARALLATATVGKPIPPALYAAVAEILAFVFKRIGRFPGGAADGRGA